MLRRGQWNYSVPATDKLIRILADRCLGVETRSGEHTPVERSSYSATAEGVTGRSPGTVVLGVASALVAAPLISARDVPS